MCNYIVQRAAANLPQSTTQTLFNISGGRVLLLGLVGDVTTSVQAQGDTGTVAIGGNTLWTAALGSAAAGTLIGGSNQTDTAAIAPLPAGGSLVAQSGAAVTFACTASNTGQIRWTLWYQPIDPGATVTAA